MRTLLAGLVCLAIGIGLTEYQRRHPKKADGTEEKETPKTPAKPALPKGVAELLETDAPGTDTPAPGTELEALLSTPAANGDKFAVVTQGKFEARSLRGGFGASLFIIEADGKAGIVRAAVGEPTKVLFTRKRIDALAVDGSTVFFAEGGLIGSTHARGGEGVTVRARFKNATVTSLAASGDTIVATLMPRGSDPLSTDSVGAVVSLNSEGTVSLIAQEQVRPRGAQTDGKGAYWIGGYPPKLWRGALDGAFSSELYDTAEEPLQLDGDIVYFRSPLGSGVELKRMGRAGGNLQTIATGDIKALAVSSGLVRYATGGSDAKLLEVAAGSEPTELLPLTSSVRGVAVGGTNLFVLTQSDDGTAVLRAK